MVGFFSFVEAKKSTKHSILGNFPLFSFRRSKNFYAFQIECDIKLSIHIMLDITLCDFPTSLVQALWPMLREREYYMNSCMACIVRYLI